MKSPPRGPIDADDVRLEVGDPVVSTPLYDDARTYTGEVVRLVRGRIVEIRRDDGQVRRSSSRLWRKKGLTMGSHINKDGEFQSDKYPTCPAGKVPLSVKDETAKDLLWEYAQRRRVVDPEFAADLETALKAKGFDILAHAYEKHGEALATYREELLEPKGAESALQRIARAAGVEDADTFGAILQRVQALHDGVLRSHRIVADEKGYDICGDCGADIEDALTDGLVCPKKAVEPSAAFDELGALFGLEVTRRSPERIVACAKEVLRQLGRAGGGDIG